MSEEASTKKVGEATFNNSCTSGSFVDSSSFDKDNSRQEDSRE